MDIVNAVGKKSHTETCWIYTQKGYDHLVRKQVSPENLATRKPGMPVPEYYRKSCPLWWTHNGWVEESEGQLSLF